MSEIFAGVCGSIDFDSTLNGFLLLLKFLIYK